MILQQKRKKKKRNCSAISTTGNIIVFNLMLEYVNEETLTANPMHRPYQEPFVPQLTHVLLRFGRWDEILSQRFPKDQNVMPYTYATLLYARAVGIGGLRTCGGSDRRGEVVPRGV